MDSYEKLVKLVTGLGTDAAKTAAGQRAAATRLRKGMQTVIAQAKVVRTEALTMTKGE